MNKDINKQKFIYFYSPVGTWTRINKNLESLGLDKNKRVGNTYTRDFSLEVLNNTYMEKYKDYDVIYLDEFYDFTFNTPDCFESGIKAMRELVANGKQIVMAGHGDYKTLEFLGEDFLKEIAYYELEYGLGFDTSIKYIEGE